MNIYLFPNYDFTELLSDQILREMGYPDPITQWVLPVIQDPRYNRLAGVYLDNILTNGKKIDLTAIRLHSCYTLELLDQIITHEVYHKIIDDFEGLEVTTQFDNIAEGFLEEDTINFDELEEQLINKLEFDDDEWPEYLNPFEEFLEEPKEPKKYPDFESFLYW